MLDRVSSTVTKIARRDFWLTIALWVATVVIWLTIAGIGYLAFT